MNNTTFSGNPSEPLTYDKVIKAKKDLQNSFDNLGTEPFTARAAKKLYELMKKFKNINN